MKTYGQRMKECRGDNDLTQLELAEKLRINPNQLGKYERNEQQMTLPIFKKWLIELKISADYILDIPKGMYDPR